MDIWTGNDPYSKQKTVKKGLGNDILSKFNRYQCDQIWQIFANLAKFQTSLSIY